jgi:hypothetical protein
MLKPHGCACNWWLATFLTVLLSACWSDAVVYRAAPVETTDRNDAGMRDAGMGGAGGRSGRGPGPDDICTGGRDVASLAESIFEIVVDSVTVNLRCTADTDCDLSPVFARCDTAQQLCVGCPNPGAKLADLTACLADARERCCTAPESPVDCVYRNCVPGCNGQ